MKNLVIYFNIIIWVGFVIWVGWYVFRNKMRFNKAGSILFAAFYCMMIIAVPFICFKNVNWTKELIGSHRAAVSITARIITIFAANLIIKKSFFRILFYMTLLDSLRDFFLYYESIVIYNIWELSFQSIVLYLSIAALLVFTIYCLYRFIQFLENNIAEFETIKDSNIWKYLWIIPAFLSIIFRVNNMQRYNVLRYSFEIESFLFIFLWYVGSLACYYTITRMVYELNKIIKAENDLKVEKIKFKALQERYDIFINDEKKIRFIKHDMRHHMRIMEQMSEKGEYDALTSYLHDYIEESAVEEKTLLCENITVDSLMGYYKSEAYKNNIKITMSLNVPKKIGICDTHLTIIIGNLMENAIEACRRQETGEKFIEARIDIVKRNMMAVIIKNSYSGCLEKNKEGRFYSKKESNVKRTGTGIGSVISIVEKYNGIQDFVTEEGVFKAYILLNLKNESLGG